MASEVVKRPSELDSIERHSARLLRITERELRVGAKIHAADVGIVAEVDMPVMRVPLTVVERRERFDRLERGAKPAASTVLSA
jgi:hypothetical protein